MFMVLKRKKLLIYTCIILGLICCYVGINTVVFTNDIKSTSNKTDDDVYELSPGEALEVSGSENYFLKAKSDRELARSKSTEVLTKIIDDPSSTTEAKTKAEIQLINMTQWTEKESKIESILYAKGFAESVVFISENTTTVAIKIDKLTQEDTAKINDIVSEITGNNNIKIVEVM